MPTSDGPPLEDVELLAHLREAVSRADPPPADLDERARRAFGWDAAMAQLSEVVAVDAAQPALRTADASAVLRFQLDGVKLELEIEAGSDESISLVGVVEPAPQRLTVVEPSGEQVEVEVDARGRFVVETRATAVVLQMHLPGGRSVRTPVVELEPSQR